MTPEQESIAGGFCVFYSYGRVAGESYFCTVHHSRAETAVACRAALGLADGLLASAEPPQTPSDG